MGAPKHRWTLEEEAAIKAGVAKYGPGKWSTILRDPEFRSVLHLRSNVDLKDKWRNLNVVASGWGSRTRLAKLKDQSISMSEDVSIAYIANVEYDAGSRIPKSPAISAVPLQKGSSNIPIPRLDNLIMETIGNLKEPNGSSRTAIAACLEKMHSTPPNLEKLLATELKALTNCGKLIKIKCQYRIAPNSSYLGSEKKPSPLLQDVEQDLSPRAEMNTITLKKEDIDVELEKMRTMTAQEASAFAVKAVAEAEAAIAEAEKAAREAEMAESDAELAQEFAAAAMKALRQTKLCT